MGISAGGGVRVSCLFGVKTGVVLVGFVVGLFVFLALVWALGAMFGFGGLGARIFTSRGGGRTVTFRWGFLGLACAGVPKGAFPAFLGW